MLLLRVKAQVVILVERDLNNLSHLFFLSKFPKLLAQELSGLDMFNDPCLTMQPSAALLVSIRCSEHVLQCQSVCTSNLHLVNLLIFICFLGIYFILEFYSDSLDKGNLFEGQFLGKVSVPHYPISLFSRSLQIYTNALNIYAPYFLRCFNNFQQTCNIISLRKNYYKISHQNQ